MTTKKLKPGGSALTKRPPRNERTPVTEAGFVIAEVTRLYCERLAGWKTMTSAQRRTVRQGFHERCVMPMVNDGTTGAVVLRSVEEKTALADMMQAAVAFAIEAEVACVRDQRDLAWANAAQAMLLLGWISAMGDVLPHALMGKRASGAHAIAASAPRKVSAPTREAIRRAYARRVAAGQKYGAIKALSAEYDLSRTTISELLNEEK